MTVEKCRKLFGENKYTEVIEISNEILKSDLNNRSALGYKVRSLNFLGNHDEALKLIENVLKLYPNNYHYHYIKAEILIEMEEYENAIKTYEKIFEIGVGDETRLAFIKMDYETAFSFIIDHLIENEKYVDAWKYYNRQMDIQKESMNSPQMIKKFMNYLAGYTTRGKSRYYYVKITSIDFKEKLMKFLKDNGFKGNDKGILFKIDVIDKKYESFSVNDVGDNSIISESKFYDKVNYYPRGKIKYKEIFDEDCNLLYEGYTLNGSPYGFGRAYFSDGILYREGIFDIKGIVQGKEYYPNGNLRFEGTWSLTLGYGPNAPYYGNAYDENGDLIYSGAFKIIRGGVGWPMIQEPKGFGCEQKERPKIDYYRG